MNERLFWKIVAVATVLGLFAVAFGLCRNSPWSSPSLSAAAYAHDAPPVNRIPVDKPKLEFKLLNTELEISRAKVPGGWLVLSLDRGHSVAFYPDPEHKWNGGSVE